MVLFDAQKRKEDPYRSVFSLEKKFDPRFEPKQICWEILLAHQAVTSKWGLTAFVLDPEMGHPREKDLGPGGIQCRQVATCDSGVAGRARPSTAPQEAKLERHGHGRIWKDMDERYGRVEIQLTNFRFGSLPDDLFQEINLFTLILIDNREKGLQCSKLLVVSDVSRSTPTRSGSMRSRPAVALETQLPWGGRTCKGNDDLAVSLNASGRVSIPRFHHVPSLPLFPLGFKGRIL